MLGRIEIDNRHCIDGDIAAFEGLITAILFYDDLYYLDDYKEEFKVDRRTDFPFLRKFGICDNVYNEALRFGQNILSDLEIKVKNGKIEDGLIKNLLEMLNMNTCFCFDLCSSNFFLNMKMLKSNKDSCEDIKKYTIFYQMIFKGLRELQKHQKLSEDINCKFIKDNDMSYPCKIDNISYDISKELNAFISSLSWLILRTSMYIFLGNSFDAVPILHPIRHDFQLKCLSRYFNLSTSVKKNIINKFSETTDTTLHQINDIFEPSIIDIKIPVFTSWLASKVDNPNDYIAKAWDIRNENHIKNVREKITNLNQIYSESFEKNTNLKIEINKIIRDIKISSKNILKEYGVETPQGIPVSKIIALFTNILDVIDIKIPLSSSLQKVLNSIVLRRGIKGVFRSIVNDINSISRLGELHDRIASNVCFDESKKEYHDATAKVEDEKYFGKSCYWKKKM